MFKGLVLISLLAITSCVDTNGKLNVLKNFEVNTSNGLVSISAGSYKSKVSVSKNKLKINLASADNKLNFELKSDKNLNIPSNGKFSLLAADINQDFDVHGENETKITKSSTKTENKSCTFRDSNVVCTPQGCTTQIIDRVGFQRTDYYIETTQVKVEFDITSINLPNEVISQFSTSNTSTKQVIVRQGICG